MGSMPPKGVSPIALYYVVNYVYNSLVFNKGYHSSLLLVSVTLSLVNCTKRRIERHFWASADPADQTKTPSPPRIDICNFGNLASELILDRLRV